MLLFAKPGLQAHNMYAPDCLFVRSLAGALERKHIHLIAPVGQSLSIADHAIVALVERVCDHADALGFRAERQLERCREGGNFFGQRLPEGWPVLLADILKELGV